MLWLSWMPNARALIGEPASMPALATASDAELLTQTLKRQHESAMTLLVKNEIPAGAGRFRVTFYVWSRKRRRFERFDPARFPRVVRARRGHRVGVTARCVASRGAIHDETRVTRR